MTEEPVQVGDIVAARLSPQRTDDLTPAAQTLADSAVVLQWTAQRVIDYSDAYDGQLRMELSLDDYERTGIWWVPLCDLTDITKVGIDADVAKLHALLGNSEEL